MTAPVSEVIARFQSRTVLDPSTGCWVYGGQPSYDSVQTTYAGRRRLLHRMIYEAEFGPPPADYLIAHICRNGKCLNPRHLQALDPAAHRARRRGRPLRNRQAEMLTKHLAGDSGS